MIIKNTIILLFLWVSAQPAVSHTLGSSFLFLSEQSPGRFSLNWTPSALLDTQPDVAPVFPDQCSAIDTILDCNPVGLEGSIRFPELPLHADVIVRIEWQDGTEYTQIVDQNTLSVELDSTNRPLKSDLISVMRTYTLIGIEHILLGIDHLLFVVGLILLVNFHKKLIWTITAFTLAHSLTLAFSVVGIITVSQTPVEILIALSIVLVASESMSQRQTFARRYPWIVAFMFGLVHGLGFAGALREVGLPEHAIPASLLSFNIGVEIGQLVVIGSIYLLSLGMIRIFYLKAVSTSPSVENTTHPTALNRLVTIMCKKYGLKAFHLNRIQVRIPLIGITYILGSMGAYWAISRSAGYL
jgi:hydrogenase/urease accessory protein HupE